ncbi:MAG: translation initiation factor IF-2 [Candidatus Omnitrophota bacterium]|nr:translation initiation factor IF-2 [Candidatus Omnitrophota bacterium]
MIKKSKDKEKPVVKPARRSPGEGGKIATKVAAVKPKTAKKPAAVKPKAVKKEIKPVKVAVKKEKEVKVEAPKKVEPVVKKEAAVKVVIPKAPEIPKKIEAPVKADAAPKVEVPKKADLAKKIEELKKVEEIKVVVEEPKVRILELELPIALKDLASQIGVKSNELIMKLMAKNVFATINQNLGEDMVIDLLKDYGIEFRKPARLEGEMVKEHREMEEKQDMKNVVTRPPVVTFMGHVDHGKTSLLDFIRKTRVADKEKGGITQHIGAYEIKLPNGSVTFLDTPGHEAFTAMRARGASATDVVVLVVAADDGVMPQTKEAIDHARVAGVPIVVAMNKCDLPTANIEKVKGQLSQIGLAPEDWGGKTITMPVSAKTGEGVDKLLELLLLEAELLELKANPSLKARGVVIEGKLSSGQGPVATILVKNGTLHLGDMVLSGSHYGRVKAMLNHKGERIESAPPSKPVSILGLSGVPMAGEEFFVVKDEKKARTLSLLKQDEVRAHKLRSSKRVTLEDFYKKMKEGVTKELAILLKGDVQGSIEAIQKSLLELNTKDVKITIVHSDVGNINESDVMLAVVSNAVVMGFNVKVDERAVELAAKEEIEIKIYGIIYEAIQDVIAAMEGLLEPISKEILVGRALVKQVFRVSKAGTIAGCQVMRGKMARHGLAKLIRAKQVVYEGKIGGLKRFKDDVKEVNEGVECGIGLDRHDDIREGDLIELYSIEKVARRLDSRKP